MIDFIASVLSESHRQFDLATGDEFFRQGRDRSLTSETITLPRLYGILMILFFVGANHHDNYPNGWGWFIRHCCSLIFL